MALSRSLPKPYHCTLVVAAISKDSHSFSLRLAAFELFYNSAPWSKKKFAWGSVWLYDKHLSMVYRDSSCPPKVIIFDWDDTICPSSFVDRCQIENVAELSKDVSLVDQFGARENDITALPSFPIIQSHSGICYPSHLILLFCFCFKVPVAFLGSSKDC